MEIVSSSRKLVRIILWLSALMTGTLFLIASTENGFHFGPPHSRSAFEVLGFALGISLTSISLILLLCSQKKIVLTDCDFAIHFFGRRPRIYPWDRLMLWGECPSAVLLQAGDGKLYQIDKSVMRNEDAGKLGLFLADRFPERRTEVETGVEGVLNLRQK